MSQLVLKQSKQGRAWPRAIGLTGVLVALCLASGCGDDDASSCPLGQESCPCDSEGSCLAGLMCIDSPTTSSGDVCIPATIRERNTPTGEAEGEGTAAEGEGTTTGEGEATAGTGGMAMDAEGAAGMTSEAMAGAGGMAAAMTVTAGAGGAATAP